MPAVLQTEKTSVAVAAVVVVNHEVFCLRILWEKEVYQKMLN